MKKKHILMAISLGVAVGLYLGVNADLEKSNLSKVIGEIGECVKQGFGEDEEARHYHEQEKGVYEIRNAIPKESEGTILCENTICFPPSKRNG